MFNIQARSMAILAAAVLMGGCATAPKTSSERMDLHDKVVAAINDFEQTDSGMHDLLHNNSVGYAMFPDVGKGGLIVGAAYGHGEVFRHGRSIGWADMTLGSVGAQVGGEEYAELIVFQTREALYRFRNNNFTFGANASAVALKAGAAASAEFKDGVAVFVKTTGGLMAEASLSGQKFNFIPKNETNRDNENYNNSNNNENYNNNENNNNPNNNNPNNNVNNNDNTQNQ